MSTVNLDKTLDDIIGTSKPRVARRRGRASSSGVTKKAPAAAKDTKKPARRPAPKKTNSDDPFYQAVKVTVSNFPVDITEQKLKEFLSKDIGVVKACEGVYARNGKPTGKFTVEFRDEGKALATFNKLNGMPMDNGAKILAVEIHTDPTRKSLASRLGGLSKDTKKDTKKDVKKDAKKPQEKKVRQKKKAAPRKRVAKSAEELDAEMDEYINQKDDVITV